MGYGGFVNRRLWYGENGADSFRRYTWRDAGFYRYGRSPAMVDWCSQALMTIARVSLKFNEKTFL
jgi:hypothetical protein